MLLHTVLDCLRVLGLLSDLLDSKVDDSFKSVDLICNLVSRSGKQSNLDTLSQIFEHIMNPIKFEKIINLQTSVTNLLGKERVMKNSGLLKLFSLFYKLIVASELAITQ